jgi:hypothetical protein
MESIVTEALQKVQKMKDEILSTDTTKTQSAKVGERVITFKELSKIFSNRKD